MFSGLICLHHFYPDIDFASYILRSHPRFKEIVSSHLLHDDLNNRSYEVSPPPPAVTLLPALPRAIVTIFKVARLRSSLIMYDPAKANVFFLPFSINNLRNDPRLHSKQSISEFVGHYSTTISNLNSFFNFRFKWNSRGYRAFIKRVDALGLPFSFQYNKNFSPNTLYYNGSYFVSFVTLNRFVYWRFKPHRKHQIIKLTKGKGKALV